MTLCAMPNLHSIRPQVRPRVSPYSKYCMVSIHALPLISLPSQRVPSLVGRPTREWKRSKSSTQRYGPGLKSLISTTRSTPTRAGEMSNSSPGISCGFIWERKGFQAKGNPSYFPGPMGLSKCWKRSLQDRIVRRIWGIRHLQCGRFKSLFGCGRDASKFEDKLFSSWGGWWGSIPRRVHNQGCLRPKQGNSFLDGSLWNLTAGIVQELARLCDPGVLNSRRFKAQLFILSLGIFS